MCNLKEIVRFIINGAETFRNASKGTYNQSSREVNEFRSEIFQKNQSRADDRYNLLKDKKNIERDVRVSFDKLSVSNV